VVSFCDFSEIVRELGLAYMLGLGEEDRPIGRGAGSPETY